MRKRRDLQAWMMVLALLVGGLLILLLNTLPEKAEGYRGIYALADSITFHGTVMDTSGTIGATFSAFEAFIYKPNTVAAYESTTVVTYPKPGEWMVRRLASDGSTTGEYHAIFRYTIQGYSMASSECWQVGLSGFENVDTTNTWAAITEADCDTVKLSGLPLADAHVIVTLSSDTSTPVYWGKTDASGCFQVYVRKGATYKVRPVYQGTWLASWCTVTK